MRFKGVLILLVLFATVAWGQEREENESKEKRKPPVFHEVSNKDVVTSVFPDAVKVEKVIETKKTEKVEIRKRKALPGLLKTQGSRNEEG